MKKNISKPLRRVLSVALSLVFACQMALPAFAQAATTPQTGTTTPPTTEQQPAQGTTNNPTGTTGTDGTTGTTDASGTTGTHGIFSIRLRGARFLIQLCPPSLPIPTS